MPPASGQEPPDASSADNQLLPLHLHTEKDNLLIVYITFIYTIIVVSTKDKMFFLLESFEIYI